MEKDIELRSHPERCVVKQRVGREITTSTVNHGIFEMATTSKFKCGVLKVFTWTHLKYSQASAVSLQWLIAAFLGIGNGLEFEDCEFLPKSVAKPVKVVRCSCQTYSTIMIHSIAHWTLKTSPKTYRIFKYNFEFSPSSLPHLNAKDLQVTQIRETSFCLLKNHLGPTKPNSNRVSPEICRAYKKHHKFKAKKYTTLEKTDVPVLLHLRNLSVYFALMDLYFGGVLFYFFCLALRLLTFISFFFGVLMDL